MKEPIRGLPAEGRGPTAAGGAGARRPAAGGGPKPGKPGEGVARGGGAHKGKRPGAPAGTAKAGKAQATNSEESQDAKARRCRSGPKSKSSKFIGVSQYRRTGRWEAHIWDASGIPNVKGRQLHLGSFDDVHDAARAYDRAALHFRGAKGNTNFPAEQYLHDPVLEALKGLGKEAFVQRLRAVAQTVRSKNKARKARRAAPGGGGPEHKKMRAPAKKKARDGGPGGAPGAGAPAGKKRKLIVQAKKASPPLPQNKAAQTKRPRPKKVKLAPATPGRGSSGGLPGSPSDSLTVTADMIPLSRAFHLGNGASVLNPDLFGSVEQDAHTILAATLGGPPWRGVSVPYGEPAHEGHPFGQEQHAEAEASARARARATAIAAAALYGEPPSEGGSFLEQPLFDTGSPDRSDQTAPMTRGPLEGGGELSLLHQLARGLPDMDTRLRIEAEVEAFVAGGAAPIPLLQVTPAQVPAPGKGEDWGECLTPVEGPEWSEFDQSLAATVVEGVGEVSAELVQRTPAGSSPPGTGL